MSNIAEIENRIYDVVNPTLSKWGTHYTGTDINDYDDYVAMSESTKEIVIDEIRNFYGFDSVEWTNTRSVNENLTTKARIFREEHQNKYSGKNCIMYAIIYTPTVNPTTGRAKPMFVMAVE
jgi:hypothetical protein